MLYIAYGANTNHLSMADRCPDAEYLGKTTLHGYRLMFRGVADVIPADDKVHVALWNISRQDEKNLDRFEGYPTLYQKKIVVVPFGGRSVTAMVYYMVSGRRNFRPPSQYYYDTLHEGYQDCGIPIRQLTTADRKSSYIENQLYGKGDWASFIRASRQEV